MTDQARVVKSKKVTDECERVAMALCRSHGAKWDARNCNETMNGEEPDEQRDYYRDLARVAIRVLRK